jgi:putative transposase
VLVTLDDEMKLPEVPEDPQRILGIDLGVDNFAAVAGNFGDAPFLISGKLVKAMNQWFNKRRAKLVSSLTKGSNSTESVKDSHALDVLSRKREDFLRDFFYKCAWNICRYAEENKVDVIVTGHNTGQKQEISLGRENNQAFVSIPFLQFISILSNTAAKSGIPVVSREESYTSQASLLDMDYIPTYKKDDDKAEFSGKRVHRGLYRAQDGTLLNADVNGAGNILRKEYPHAFDQVDMAYLSATTKVVPFGSLYQAAACAKKTHKSHNQGTGSLVRNRYRSNRRTVYRTLFGKGKRIWKPKTAASQPAA